MYRWFRTEVPLGRKMNQNMSRWFGLKADNRLIEPKNRSEAKRITSLEVDHM